jgi:hypothetical protein
MEAWWISVLIGGRAPPSVLRALFFIFRVKVCKGEVQVMVAVPQAIRSPWLQPHLGGNVKRLVGVVWSSWILSGCGDLRIVKELHRQFFLLLCLRDGCGLLDPFGDFPSATNNSRPTREGAAAAAPRAIRSPWLQPHLDDNVKRLVGVVWSSWISSGCGDLRIVKELHQQFFLLLCLRDRCGLLDPFGDFPSATNNSRPTQEGAAVAVPRVIRSP